MMSQFTLIKMSDYWRATNVLSVSEVNEQNRNHMKRISDSLFKFLKK
jgi:phosphoketolase